MCAATATLGGCCAFTLLCMSMFERHVASPSLALVRSLVSAFCLLAAGLRLTIATQFVCGVSTEKDPCALNCALVKLVARQQLFGMLALGPLQSLLQAGPLLGAGCHRVRAQRLSSPHTAPLATDWMLARMSSSATKRTSFI